MGIFDSHVADLQKEVSRVTDGLGKMQNNAQKVVKAIDNLEDKVTHLPTEQEIKNKLKQKIKVGSKTKTKKEKPTKSPSS